MGNNEPSSVPQEPESASLSLLKVLSPQQLSAMREAFQISDLDISGDAYNPFSVEQYPQYFAYAKFLALRDRFPAVLQALSPEQIRAVAKTTLNWDAIRFISSVLSQLSPEVIVFLGQKYWQGSGLYVRDCLAKFMRGGNFSVGGAEMAFIEPDQAKIELFNY